MRSGVLFVTIEKISFQPTQGTEMKKLVFVFVLFLTLFTAGESVFALDYTRRLDPFEADSLALLTPDPLLQSDIYSLAWQHMKSLQVLEATDKEDAETLWRIARARTDIAENLTGDLALKAFEQAMTEAQIAIDLAPDNAMAQQTLSVVTGRVALYKGVFKSIGLVKQVHTAGLRAVANSDSVPIALYVLGKTHKKLIAKSGLARKALGLGWASADSVTYYFDRAIEVSRGNMIQCYVEYAEFLIDQKGDRTEINSMLKRALYLPLRDEHDEEAKKLANELLKKVE